MPRPRRRVSIGVGQNFATQLCMFTIEACTTGLRICFITPTQSNLVQRLCSYVQPVCNLRKSLFHQENGSKIQWLKIINITNLNKWRSLYENYNRKNSPDSNFFELEATIAEQSEPELHLACPNDLHVIRVKHFSLKNLFTTKSSERISDFCLDVKPLASTHSRSIGIQLFSINWIITSSEATRPTLPKKTICCGVKPAFCNIEWAPKLSGLNQIYDEIAHLSCPGQLNAPPGLWRQHRQCY